jgi:hypothetical protein
MVYSCLYENYQRLLDHCEGGDSAISKQVSIRQRCHKEVPYLPFWQLIPNCRAGLHDIDRPPIGFSVNPSWHRTSALVHPQIQVGAAVPVRAGCSAAKPSRADG